MEIGKPSLKFLSIQHAASRFEYVYRRRWSYCRVIRKCNASSGPFHQHGLTFIAAWISNYIHYNGWDGITYPFLNFNGATVEV